MNITTQLLELFRRELLNEIEGKSINGSVLIEVLCRIPNRFSLMIVLCVRESMC